MLFRSFDFVTKMRERDIDVLEMHNLLTDIVAIPEALRLSIRALVWPKAPRRTNACWSALACLPCWLTLPACLLT